MKGILKPDLNLKSVVEALLVSLLVVIPTGVVFGILTRSESGLWHLIVALHACGFICTFIVLLLPEDKQWRFLKAVARFSIQRHHHDLANYDPESDLDELKQKRHMESAGNVVDK